MQVINAVSAVVMMLLSSILGHVVPGLVPSGERAGMDGACMQVSLYCKGVAVDLSSFFVCPALPTLFFQLSVF